MSYEEAEIGSGILSRIGAAKGGEILKKFWLLKYGSKLQVLVTLLLAL